MFLYDYDMAGCEVGHICIRSHAMEHSRCAAYGADEAGRGHVAAGVPASWRNLKSDTKTMAGYAVTVCRCAKIVSRDVPKLSEPFLARFSL